MTGGPTPTADDMIAAAMPLARALAARCRNKGVDDDTLESEVMLALVDAARTYRAGRYGERTFKRWAEVWVVRRLRKLVADAPLCHFAEIPRELRRQAAKVRAAAEVLAARGIRRPTTEELAYEAMATVEDVELVRAIPDVVAVQGIADYADPRAGRPVDEPVLMPLFPITSFTPQSGCPHRGRIRTESSFCCMVCHASGKDGRRALRRDPRDEPAPEPKGATPPADAGKPGKATRKERRQLLFGPQPIEAA